MDKLKKLNIMLIICLLVSLFFTSILFNQNSNLKEEVSSYKDLNNAIKEYHKSKEVWSCYDGVYNTQILMKEKYNISINKSDYDIVTESCDKLINKGLNESEQVIYNNT